MSHTPPPSASHLEKLQQTVQKLDLQSQTLQTLTSVYARMEATEKGYARNLEALHLLQAQLAAHREALAAQVAHLLEENRTLEQKVEAAYMQMVEKHTQLTELEGHLQAQTTDLQKKIEQHTAQFRQALQAHQQGLDEKIKALTQQNEAFYQQTSESLAFRLQNVQQQVTQFYEQTRSRLEERLTALATQNENHHTRIQTALEGRLHELFTQQAAYLAHLEPTTRTLAQAVSELDKYGRHLSEYECIIAQQGEQLATLANPIQTIDQYQKQAFKHLYQALVQEGKANAEKIAKSVAEAQNQASEGLKQDLKNGQNTLQNKVESDLQAQKQALAEALQVQGMQAKQNFETLREKIENIEKQHLAHWEVFSENINNQLAPIEQGLEMKLKLETQTLGRRVQQQGAFLWVAIGLGLLNLVMLLLLYFK
jgi:chromosome segregation ATPase